MLRLQRANNENTRDNEGVSVRKSYRSYFETMWDFLTSYSISETVQQHINWFTNTDRNHYELRCPLCTEVHS